MQDKTTRRAQKLQIIEDWQQSCRSQKIFCAEHNITLSTFITGTGFISRLRKALTAFCPLAVKDNSDEPVTLAGYPSGQPPPN